MKSPFAVILIAIFFAASGSNNMVHAQTPTPTPTPTPPPATLPPGATVAPHTLLDHLVLNTSYVDLILDFANLEDYDGGLQSSWRFLKRLCGHEPIYRDFYRQYSLHRLPAPVGRTWNRCQIGDPSLGNLSLPSVAIKLSSRGLPVIPYTAYQQYLVSLVFRGSQQQLYNFTQMVLVDEQEAMLVMGISGVMTLPADQGDVYAAGQVYLTVDEQATLSIAWHVIIVSFFLLVIGIVFTFIMRSKNNRSQDDGGEKDPDDLLDEEDEEARDRAAERWQEPDVEMIRKDLHNEVSLLEPEKVKHFSEHYSQPLISQQMEYDKQQKQQQLHGHSGFNHNESHNDLNASLPFAAATALRNNRNAKKDKSKYNPQAFEEALAFEPALNMPPEDRAVRATKSIQDRIRDKKNKAEEEKRNRAEKERRELMADVEGDLPPDQEVMEMLREKQQEKRRKELPPMGLASRRMAAMMSTIAINPNAAQVRAGSVGPMMGGMVSSNVRRTVSALPLLPPKPKVPAEEPGLLVVPEGEEEATINATPDPSKILAPSSSQTPPPPPPSDTPPVQSLTGSPQPGPPARSPAPGPPAGSPPPPTPPTSASASLEPKPVAAHLQPPTYTVDDVDL